MRIIVQKFGGTSVATKETREFVYSKIMKAKDKGYDLVVIVSAMGRHGDPYATDTLLDLVKKDNKNCNKREMDMIYSCGEIISSSIIASNLTNMGYKSISLTGQQAGIITDNNYFNSKVTNVDTNKIKNYLEQGFIPIVAGSQGVAENGDITTLGRGGSDISAVVLGMALNAEKTIIYTDVEGVMTADPCKVQNANLIEKISYDSIKSIAENGAKVIHPRAIEAAQKYKNTSLYIRSTFSENIGTLICNSDEIQQDCEILSITKKDTSNNQVVICLIGEVISDTINKKIKEFLKGNQIDFKDYNTDKQKINFTVSNIIADNLINELHDFMYNHKNDKCIKKLA